MRAPPTPTAGGRPPGCQRAAKTMRPSARAPAEALNAALNPTDANSGRSERLSPTAPHEPGPKPGRRAWESDEYTARGMHGLPATPGTRRARRRGRRNEDDAAEPPSGTARSRGPEAHAPWQHAPDGRGTAVRGWTAPRAMIGRPQGPRRAWPAAGRPRVRSSACAHRGTPPEAAEARRPTCDDEAGHTERRQDLEADAPGVRTVGGGCSAGWGVPPARAREESCLLRRSRRGRRHRATRSGQVNERLESPRVHRGREQGSGSGGCWCTRCMTPRQLPSRQYLQRPTGSSHGSSVPRHSCWEVSQHRMSSVRTSTWRVRGATPSSWSWWTA